jgi:hypothetical protein
MAVPSTASHGSENSGVSPGSPCRPAHGWGAKGVDGWLELPPQVVNERPGPQLDLDHVEYLRAPVPAR